MKLHLKLTSVLLSAVMCASMVMAPVSVIADETSAPEETHTTEASEKEETKETEKKTPKATEKPEPKETKATEKTEPEEQKPAETDKETDPTETEDKKPAQTTETEPSHSEEKKPAESNKEEPSEPATTSESKKEDVPETTVRRAKRKKLIEFRARMPEQVLHLFPSLWTHLRSEQSRTIRQCSRQVQTTILMHIMKKIIAMILYGMILHQATM